MEPVTLDERRVAVEFVGAYMTNGRDERGLLETEKHIRRVLADEIHGITPDRALVAVTDLAFVLLGVAARQRYSHDDPDWVEEDPDADNDPEGVHQWMHQILAIIGQQTENPG